MRRRRCIKKSGWGARGEGAAPPPAKQSMFLDRRRWTQKEVEREREERRSPPLKKKPPPSRSPLPPFFFLGGAAPHWRLPFKEALPWRSHPPLKKVGTPTLSGRSLSVCLSVYLSIYLSICLSAYLPICLSIYQIRFMTRNHFICGFWSRAISALSLADCVQMRFPGCLGCTCFGCWRRPVFQWLRSCVCYIPPRSQTWRIYAC